LAETVEVREFTMKHSRGVPVIAVVEEARFLCRLR
jgi:hypothetical protein